MDRRPSDRRIRGARLGGRARPTKRAGTCGSSGRSCSGATAGSGSRGPREYGGRGADVAQQIVFNEEYAKANAPARISFFGEGLFAPTLIQFGTDAQKRRFLPPIQAVDELWCQGFSEPNAGSGPRQHPDRAVLDGDEWVVTGQKVWTTLAHRADWCFVVVSHRSRVDSPPRALVPVGADAPARRSRCDRYAR